MGKEIIIPNRVCSLGLGLGLGLNGGQNGGGGGASGDYTNIAYSLVMDPTADAATMYETDGATDPIEGDNGESVVRWYPTVKPANIDYFRDASSAYPLYRDGANGINSNPTVNYVNGANVHLLVGASFTWDDIVNAGSCVFGMCGAVPTSGAAGDRAILGNSSTHPIQTYFTTTGTVRTRFTMGSSQNLDLAVTPDAGGLFAIVAWFHDGVIDWWANGVKQTQIENVNNFNDVTTTTMQFMTAGSDASWELLRCHFAASHSTEADLENLAAHYETLLGR